MHPQTLALRHALARSLSRPAVAAGGASWFSSVPATATATAAATERQPLVHRGNKAPRSSNKRFNLLDSSGGGSGSQRWHKSRVQDAAASDAAGQNPKWWKKMDRGSFRKLLDECMSTGRVSSVLRKVR